MLASLMVATHPARRALAPLADGATERWEVVAAETRSRPAKRHEGEHIVVADAVLNARRR